MHAVHSAPSDLLHDARIGLPGLEIQIVAEADLPPAIRPLLVHVRGMTAVLEDHAGEAMTLSVLSSLDEGDAGAGGDTLLRKVLLAGAETGRPGEMGLIRIHLSSLPAPVAARIRAADLPFGTVLKQAGIRFTSRPHTFFTARAAGDLCRRLGHPPGAVVHGRATVLHDSAGALLAEAVEILGPITATASAS